MSETALLAALEGLHDDESFDGAMEQIYLIGKLETGLAQMADAATSGEGLTGQTELWQEIRSWV